jgi:hypothetical protein
MPVWAEVEEHFAHDGAWRDIIVPDSGPAEWQLFLAAVRAGLWKFEYLVDDERKPLPVSVGELSRDDQRLLRIDVLASGLNCHLWTDSEMELDFIPTDVSCQNDLDVLSEFCVRLASTVGKPVAVTYENFHEAAILKYSPGGQAEYVGKGLSNG